MKWINIPPNKTRLKVVGLPSRTHRHVDTKQHNFNNTFATLCDSDKVKLASLIKQLARLERENEELQAMNTTGLG
jgi:hypothetical protein